MAMHTAAHERENTGMRAWYQEWFGSAPSAGGMGMMRLNVERGSTEASRPNVHMDGMEGDLDVLRAISAEEFEREFIRLMIPHHEKAIMMAHMLQEATQRPEMKQHADNIITSQSREIEVMRELIRS